jgi:hypothetical protein
MRELSEAEMDRCFEAWGKFCQALGEVITETVQKIWQVYSDWFTGIAELISPAAERLFVLIGQAYLLKEMGGAMLGRWSE